MIFHLTIPLSGILFIILILVVVAGALWFFNLKQQEIQEHNERIYNDATKYLSGEKVEFDPDVASYFGSDDPAIIADRIMRSFKSRGDYYRNVYLKSDAWQRKRYVVLKRDNWRCVRCGNKATEVHHRKYARQIGKEPIEWLISVCKTCHDYYHW